MRRSKEIEDKLRGFATQKTPWTQDFFCQKWRFFNRDFKEAYKFHYFKIDSTDHVKYVILNERV